MSAVQVVSFAAGLLLLVIGADVVVRSGSTLAAQLGVRPIVIGLTIVSLGTSLPELAIGLSAVADGAGDLAVGNIVGTNLVNTLLILGLAALLRPITFERRTLRFDLPAAAVAALLLAFLSRDGSLTIGDGVLLTGYGVAYLAAVLRSSRGAGKDGGPSAGTGAADKPGPVRTGGRSPRAVIALGLGLAGIVVGAELLVSGATTIARAAGMSDAVVGLTIVAIGTSAPELVTTVVATFRGDRAIALGNLMGSNVFNIALVLGPTVVLSPTVVGVPDEILGGDLLLMVVTALACVPAFWTRRLLSRVEGGLFVVVYVVYLLLVVAART